MERNVTLLNAKCRYSAAPCGLCWSHERKTELPHLSPDHIEKPMKVKPFLQEKAYPKLWLQLQRSHTSCPSSEQKEEEERLSRSWLNQRHVGCTSQKGRGSRGKMGYEGDIWCPVGRACYAQETIHSAEGEEENRADMIFRNLGKAGCWGRSRRSSWEVCGELSLDLSQVLHHFGKSKGGSQLHPGRFSVTPPCIPSSSLHLPIYVLPSSCMTPRWHH